MTGALAGAGPGAPLALDALPAAPPALTRDGQRWLPLVLVGVPLAVPLALLAYVTAVPAADVPLHAHGPHEGAIGLSVATAALLGWLALRTYLATGRRERLGLAAGMLGFAAVYVWHGVFTASPHPFKFLIFGPASRLVFAACLFSIARGAGETAMQPAARLRAARAVVAGAAALAGLGFALAGPVEWLAATQAPPRLNAVRLVLETSALALAAMAAVRLARRYRATSAATDAASIGGPGPVLPLLAGTVAVAEQSVLFLLSTPWSVLWWSAHALGAVGLLVLTWAVLVAMDEAEREQAEHARLAAEVAALRRLDALKSEFVATISHELRTPLTSLSGDVHILQRRAGTLARFEEPGALASPEARAQEAGRIAAAAERMRHATIHLRHLVEELLGFAEIERGRVVVQPEVVDLAPALNAVAGEFGERPSGERLVRQVPPELWAHADPARVVQAVWHLLDNAFKYAPDGPITLRARLAEAGLAPARPPPAAGPSGALVRIEVEDEGPGVPPDEQPRVWERFYRGGRVAQFNLARGAGLGLAVVRAMVEAQGGRVGLESPLVRAPAARARGARFWLELPAAVPAAPGTPARPAAPAAPGAPAAG